MINTIDAAAKQSVQIVLVDPDVQLRNNLRQALSSAGFRTVADYNHIKKFQDDLDKIFPDLLLIDAHMPEGDTCQMIREMRMNRLGKNPFLSVILTVWQTKIDDIEKLVSSGADHILIKPIAPQAIFERMEALMERRRPFVATSTYVGPDRRKGDREGVDPIPTFHVPNTLKIKATNRKVDVDSLQRAIDQTLNKMNDEMILRLAFQIAFQVKRLLVALGKADIEGEGDQALRDLKWALMELNHRLAATAYQQIAELCNKLNTVVEGVIRAMPNPSERDRQLMVKLAEAINLGLKSNQNPAELASKVVKAMQSYESKKARKVAAKPVSTR
ncbi:MAG: response regulator [Rhodospirillales bacterium]|nr:response regulator [Rhodospirillales bacterium]